MNWMLQHREPWELGQSQGFPADIREQSVGGGKETRTTVKRHNLCNRRHLDSRDPGIV